MEAHYRSTKHFAYLRLSPQNLYCVECGDYTFCSYFDCALGKKRKFDPKPNPVSPETLEADEYAEQEEEVDIPARKCSRGLVNMGSTCFMNSVVQILTRNKQIVQSAQLLDHVSRCSILSSSSEQSNDSSTGSTLTTCIPCEFFEISKSISSHNHEEIPVIPSSLLFSIWNLIDYMVGYAQQDAHEFLLALLNGMEIQLKVLDDFNGVSLEQVYGGVIESSLMCEVCEDQSITRDNFVDLSLSLDLCSGESDLTLVKCLELYTIRERLSDKMMCSKCGKETQKIKQLRISRCPSILILHLKRFDFMRQKKINTLVDFPLYGLDLSAFCADEMLNTGKDVKPIYNLVGIVCHDGNLHQGHYTSYVRSQAQANGSTIWLRCDDENVYEVSEAEVRSAEGYMLFYSRSC